MTGKRGLHPSRTFIAATVIAVLWLVASTVVLAASLHIGQRDWAPLYGYTPVQDTEPTEIMVDGPGSLQITSTGTKCARQPVTVQGQSVWRSVDPPGSNVPVGAPVSANRPRGCVTITYINIVPREVVSLTARLGGRVRWELTGVETPSDARHAAGVPAVWRTEPIEITVDRQAG